MKNALIIVSMCLLTISISAQPNQRNQQRLQERIEAQRIAFITQKLDLSPEESAQFWPIYNAFKKAQRDKRQSLRPQTAFKSMTEEEANAFLEKQLTVESEMIDLKREYYTRLKTAIPANKLAQLQFIEMEFNRGVLEKLKERQAPNKRD